MHNNHTEGAFGRFAMNRMSNKVMGRDTKEWNRVYAEYYIRNNYLPEKINSKFWTLCDSRKWL